MYTCWSECVRCCDSCVQRKRRGLTLQRIAGPSYLANQDEKKFPRVECKDNMVYAGHYPGSQMSKTCTKCKKEKAVAEFYTEAVATAKGDRTYVDSHCKQCKKERSTAYRKANREKRRRQWRESKRRKKAGIKRKPRRTHDEINVYYRTYSKKRYYKDPNYKMRKLLRTRLCHALKGNLKAASTLKLLGTTVEHLYQHLEAQFLPGMNWQNHGRGNDKWVVDHMMPIRCFDLTQEDQQRKCFHWTNLQPLWDPDNNAKRDKVPTNRRWVDSGWVEI